MLEVRTGCGASFMSFRPSQKRRISGRRIQKLLLRHSDCDRKDLILLCRCPPSTAQPACTVPDPPHWGTCDPRSTVTATGRDLHRLWVPRTCLWKITLKMKMQRRKSPWCVCTLSRLHLHSLKSNSVVRLFEYELDISLYIFTVRRLLIFCA